VESAATVQTGTAVRTVPIENFDEPFVIEIDGESVTYRIITVPAEVEGRIVRKADECRGGSYIQSGTVLFELDPTDYQLEIDRLNALRHQSQEELKTNDVDIANNRSLLKIAEEDLGLQNRRFERIESLRKKKAATESDIDTAQLQQLTSRNSFQTISNLLRSNEQRKETIKAGLALIDAQLKKAHSDLKRTKVIARTSATVVDDLVEEGDYVKSGDPLVHLSDSSRMEIKCSLQSDELGWIWRQARMKHAEDDITPEQRYGLPLTPCEVVYDFEGFEIIWEGVLSRFEGVGLDKDTRMVPCRVLVQEPTNTRVVNPDGKAPDVVPPSLLSGMYVTVRIPIRSPIPLVKVPVEAVRPGGQLWIMRSGKLQIAKTQPVHTEREYALLRQDSLQLEAGDRVVISPLPSVSNGMPIREASRL
jgi:multidrug efflux pump subunit AcrA (membrane-fusion protein)